MNLKTPKSFTMKKSIITWAISVVCVQVMAQNISVDFEVGGSGLIDDEKRINIFILSDGYTASQEQQFLDRAQALSVQLFNGNYSSPFNAYSAYFNVYRIFVPSADAGALHPCLGCNGNAEPSCTSITGISTVFGSSYDSPPRPRKTSVRVSCVELSAISL